MQNYVEIPLDLEKLLDEIVQKSYSGKSIIEFWGVPGIGKTHLLSHIKNLAENRDLVTEQIYFPSEPASVKSLQKRLAEVMEGLVDQETGDPKTKRSTVVLIDNAPSEWQKEEIDGLIDILSPLIRLKKKNHIIVFLTGISRVISSESRTSGGRGIYRQLKGITEHFKLLPLDKNGTENQIRQLVRDRSDPFFYEKISWQIFRLTGGFPLGNKIITERVKGQLNLNETSFRRIERDLVEAIEKEIRINKLKHVPVDLYNKIRNVSVCPYFDTDIITTTNNTEALDLSEIDQLIQQMCSLSGVVRYVKDLNTYEVDPIIRKLLTRHWIITDRDEFYNQCERALIAYETRLNGKAFITKPEELDVFIRGELALLAHIYQRHDSSHDVINAILCEHLEKHLTDIYSGEIYSGLESLDKIKLIAENLRFDEDLPCQCYRDSLYAMASAFIQTHTTALLEIRFSNTTEASCYWHVPEEKESLSEPLDRDATAYINPILEEMNRISPNVDLIGNWVFGQLIPPLIAKKLAETSHSLEISVTGGAVPYELAHFDDDRVLCLTRPVGRTLPEFLNRNDSMWGWSREPRPFTKALVVAIGREDSTEVNDNLKEEVNQVASILMSHNVIVEVVSFVDSRTFLEFIAHEKHQLIHIAGHLYNQLDENGDSNVRGLLLIDGKLIQLSRLEPHFRRQRPLVFLNISRVIDETTEANYNVSSPSALTELLQVMDRSYTLSEVRILSIMSGVDFDNLEGDTKILKIWSMIQYLDRRGEMDKLFSQLLKRNELRSLVDKLKKRLVSEKRITVQGGTTSDLAESILRSGARHSVANLWSVSNDNATKFAVYFYATLMKGYSVGESVCQTRLRLYKENPSSSDWASYLLYGDPTRTLRPPRVTSEL